MTITRVDEISASLGAAIKELRLDRRLLIQDAARRIGISSDHLGRIERGVNLPSLPTLMRVAHVYGTTASDLLGALEKPKEAR